MRHRIRGRKLGRNSPHRRAMLKNMAVSLIRSVRPDEDAPNTPKTPGRIITTVAKAKELRPIIEKLITMARRALAHQENASQYVTAAEKNSAEWKQWRESEEWQNWANAIAPAVALRRRAFAQLRDNEAVDILFDELSERFADRPGGYTRVVRLAEVRLGDAGQKALIEFVGENDRIRTRRTAPIVTDDEPEDEPVEPAAEAPEEPVAEAEPTTDEAEDSKE
ncbi:MAG TPA: bL17 family ribosomal protein [Planctomycetaceae bacterium]|nr:bL17 family ribosomal protein [Planctomycetaceae bacterium]